MKEQMDRMFDLLIEINERTVRNTTILEEHERRSTASEQRLEIQEQKLDHFMQVTSEKIEPIAKHVDRVGFGIKALMALIGLVATIVGIITAL